MTSGGPERSYSIRAFEDRDVSRAFALTQGDGWTHQLPDWKFLSSTASGLVAQRKSDGEVVGTLLYWTYGTDQAAIGMVIVDPTCQRQGIGRALMDEVFRLLDGRIIHLIATTDGLPLYQKLGFVQTGMVYIFKGVSVQHSSGGEQTNGLRIATPADHQDILRILNAGVGNDRTPLLRAVLAQVNAEAALLEKNGHVAGAAIYRPFLDGYWIGPVVASDTETARSLIEFWLRRYPGRLTRVDVTDNFDAAWLEDWGLKKFNLTCPTMRRGELADPTDQNGFSQYAILAQGTG